MAERRRLEVRKTAALGSGVDGCQQGLVWVAEEVETKVWAEGIGQRRLDDGEIRRRPREAGKDGEVEEGVN